MIYEATQVSGSDTITLVTCYSGQTDSLTYCKVYKGITRKESKNLNEAQFNEKYSKGDFYAQAGMELVSNSGLTEHFVSLSFSNGSVHVYSMAHDGQVFLVIEIPPQSSQDGDNVRLTSLVEVSSSEITLFYSDRNSTLFKITLIAKNLNNDGPLTWYKVEAREFSLSSTIKGIFYDDRGN